MQIHDTSDDKLENTIRSIRSMCKQLDAVRATDPDRYAKAYAEVSKELDLTKKKDGQ